MVQSSLVLGKLSKSSWFNWFTSRQSCYKKKQKHVFRSCKNLVFKHCIKASRCWVGKRFRKANRCRSSRPGTSPPTTPSSHAISNTPLRIQFHASKVTMPGTRVVKRFRKVKLHASTDAMLQRVPQNKPSHSSALTPNNAPHYPNSMTIHNATCHVIPFIHSPVNYDVYPLPFVIFLHPKSRGLFAIFVYERQTNSDLLVDGTLSFNGTLKSTRPRNWIWYLIPL